MQQSALQIRDRLLSGLDNDYNVRIHSWLFPATSPASWPPLGPSPGTQNASTRCSSLPRLTRTRKMLDSTQIGRRKARLKFCVLQKCETKVNLFSGVKRSEVVLRSSLPQSFHLSTVEPARAEPSRAVQHHPLSREEKRVQLTRDWSVVLGERGSNQ